MDEKLKQVLDGFVLPQRKLLDHLTRTDELSIQLIKEVKGLRADITGVPVQPSWSYEQLESGEITDYAIVTQALDTATTDKLMVYPGDTIVAYCDGALAGITVKLNRGDADAIPLNYFNPLNIGRFSRFFLTWSPAQAGKTLTLFIGRNTWAKVNSPPNTAAIQPFQTLSTATATHFSTGIIQNATEEEDITGLTANKIRITGVAIQSDQQLDYKLIFFSTDGFADTTLDDDTFTSEVELDLLSYGFRIAGANQYYMAVYGLTIDYEDEDATNELHVALQNLSATAKNAGGTGEVKVIFTYEERA